MSKQFINTLSLLTLILVVVASGLYWHLTKPIPTITDSLSSYPIIGDKVLEDFVSYPLVSLSNDYTLTDSYQDGIDIQFANQTDSSESDSLVADSSAEDTLVLAFPEDLDEPLTITLPGGRQMSVIHNVEESYNRSLLASASLEDEPAWSELGIEDLRQVGSLAAEGRPDYVKYTSTDSRVSTYYAYQKDQAKGYRNLKHWTIFNDGDGMEEQSYTFTNAHIRVNDRGEAEVRYLADNYQTNQEIAAEVGGDLLARARAVVGADLAGDIVNQPADIIIPAPFIIDSFGQMTTFEWTVDDTSTELRVAIEADPLVYPIALDPTLQFTAPGTSNEVDFITGEAGSRFGQSLTSGDFNNDGTTDLAVGTYFYSSNAGRTYLFYGDGSIPTTAASADVIITGEAGSRFGRSLTSGDFNNDGTTDLAVGATSYSSNAGRAYIFYNDGSIPTTAASADVIITGQASSGFGYSLTSGDFNHDGTTDLAVGAYSYSSYTGRTYLFYNDGSIPTTAASADVIITGQAGSWFGYFITSGDFNHDGTTDLAVGAPTYFGSAGRTYLFYNDGSIPTTAASADVIITGQASSAFGSSLTSGDFNHDGQTDLAVVASIYSGLAGRAYLFYSQNGLVSTDNHTTGEAAGDRFGSAMATGDFNNDGWPDLVVGSPEYGTSQGRTYIFYGGQSATVNATGADVVLTGQTTNSIFGSTLTTGDLNADGATDLIIAAPGYNSDQGRTYIFYGGSIITENASGADVILTGAATTHTFGTALTTGDLNADGTTDLVVGSPVYNTAQGRAYIFYGGSMVTENASGADVILTGETTINRFGAALTTADLNSDGADDLVVAADVRATFQGRAYIFYGGSIITENASGADVILTGEATSNYFGRSLTTGDLNADGATDLIIAAPGYNSDQGRTYIFYGGSIITENASGADVILTGEAVGNQFSQVSVDDLNSDGLDDLIVGAPGYNSNTGRAYAYFGGTFTSSMEAATSSSLMITGDSANDDFGYSLLTMDYNRDGREDLIIGAPGYDNGGDTGRIYFYQNKENFVQELQRPTYQDGLRVDLTMGYELKITGEPTSGQFGTTLHMADLNNDGKDDLIVSAPNFNSSRGRVYIFYNDGSYPSRSSQADVILDGEATGNLFGTTLLAGDFNNDGQTDLAVGAYAYSAYTGRAYIFYGDSLTSTNALNADVTITGEATSSYFSYSLATGDFNNDGRDDLAVGANAYLGGRAYIFYGDGSIPTTAGTADVTIAGEATGNNFGISLATGDFNNDGRDDLAVGASGYTTFTGRAYIFYGDGSIPTTAGTADVIITGETTSDRFGFSFTTGDFNNDDRDDLAVGAYGYTTNTGRAYIFYGDGSIPTTAGTADVIITGETTSDRFGWSLATGDLNADGTTDLIVGAYGYNSNQGRVYMYTTNDYQITGEGTNSFFGTSLASGDFNNDGKTDLAVGATGWDDDDTGRVYIFYGGNKSSANASGADVILTGEASGNYFGRSLTTGDLNADGTDDLVVGAFVYNALQGRAYIFYGGSMISENASGADITLTGEAMFNRFGYSLATGDLNADGTDDLAVGAYDYNTAQGRAYVFYGGSMVSENASGADITLTGEATDNDFGIALTTGDLNADGTDDLVVGAFSYNSSQGRAYIFYGGSMVTENASGADVTLTGEATDDFFGAYINTADLNADGTMDLVVSSFGYNGDGSLYSGQGRAYIFYGGSLTSTNASNADAIITGNEESVYFGVVMTTGDVNADGKEDLLIGALNLSSGLTEVSFFYGGSLVDMNANQADLTFSGGGLSGYLNPQFITADINNNGVDDFIFSADGYDDPDDQGRVYILMSEAAILKASSYKIQGDIQIQGNVRFR